MSVFWTKDEEKILKKYYPVLGTRIQEFLPHRTINAIDHKARCLGIKYGLFDIGEEGYLDIETSNLNADFAYMFSWAIKVKDCNQVYSDVITKEEIFNEVFDKRITQSLIDNLRKFKRIYTYYGTNFDIPFARTRALKWNMDFPPFGLIQHQDLYYLVRNRLKLSRNRLANVCDFLGIDGNTVLDGDIWVKASVGNNEALNCVLVHNIHHVEILEKLHKKVLTYAGVNRRSL